MIRTMRWRKWLMLRTKTKMTQSETTLHDIYMTIYLLDRKVKFRNDYRIKVVKDVQIEMIQSHGNVRLRIV